jgi:hypothetical protein
MALIAPYPITIRALEADKYCFDDSILSSPTMSPLEPLNEPLYESQLDSIESPSDSTDADIDAHSHAIHIENAAVDLPPASTRRDNFYTGYSAILLGRAGPPPAPELAPSIDNLRDTKFVGPVGCRHPISAV